MTIPDVVDLIDTVRQSPELWQALGWVGAVIGLAALAIKLTLVGIWTGRGLRWTAALLVFSLVSLFVWLFRSKMGAAILKKLDDPGMIGQKGVTSRDMTVSVDHQPLEVLVNGVRAEPHLTWLDLRLIRSKVRKLTRAHCRGENATMKKLLEEQLGV
jgi:hypothetical protein